MVTLGAGECVEVISIVTVIGEHHWQLEDRAGGAERPCLVQTISPTNLLHEVTCVPLLINSGMGGGVRGKQRIVRGLCSQLRHLDLL